MTMNTKFKGIKIPEEMIKKAQKTSIVDFCAANDLPLVKISNGNFMMADNHSLRINAVDNLYNDFGVPEGTQFKGGDVINFARVTCGYSFSEAVENILEIPEAGQLSLKKYPYLSKKKEDYQTPTNIFDLSGGMVRVNHYLTNERGIDPEIVEKLYNKGLIEQTKRGEVFFHWLTPFADRKQDVGGTIQGTTPLANPLDPSRLYKKMIYPNSTTGYGFNFTIGEAPKSIAFSESPIDLISYYEIKQKVGEEKATHYQSIEGLKVNVVENTVDLFQKKFGHYPDKLIIALDNDQAGKETYLKIKELPIVKENKLKIVSGIPQKASGIEKMDWNKKLSELKMGKQSLLRQQKPVIKR